MVKTSELEVKGTASQYLSERPVIYCIKKVDDKHHIPCIYHKKEGQYKHIDFPEPNIPFRNDQIKVMDEMEEICKKQQLQAEKEYEEDIELQKKDPSKPTRRMKDENGNVVVATHCIFGHIYTGFGKSAVSSYFAAKKKGPILIFCNTDAVRQGWIGTWKEFFGIEPVQASGSTLGRHDVCICSIQLAVLHTDEYRDDLKHYKTVICDEADTLCTQLAVNVLLELKPKYLIGLTATVRRNDGLDKVLDVFWGPRKGWIQRLKEFGETCTMTLNILYTPFQIDSVYNRKNSLDWMAIAQTTSNLYERNLLIRNLCLLHMKSKILILTKTKDHVELLRDMLQEVRVDVSTYYERAKSYYDAQVLVCTLSKAGRGYDDKQVSAAFDGRRFDVLILCITMKDADQALGRALRGETLSVYLLVDNNSTMKNHAEEMKKINSRRGAIIVEEYM